MASTNMAYSRNRLRPVSANDESSVQFTTLLRIASGQEHEPEFVLVEHAYARPWDWQTVTLNSHPRKTLFLSKLPKAQSEELIDVVKDFPLDAEVPYDLVRGRHLMSECERHVVFAKLNRGGKQQEEGEEKEDGDWEEVIDKSGWSDAQKTLFNRIVKILDSDRLARLTLKDIVNEPIKRRAQIDKTAAKFRQTLGRVHWDLRLTQWLHNTLLQNMSTHYLSAYLDILQTLKSKIPNLVDKMITLSATHKGPNMEALNLLLKRPWDPAVPVLNQQKPKKLESHPIIIQVPSCSTSPHVPQASRRLRFFNSQLQHLVKCIPVSVSSDSGDSETILEQMMVEVQTRIADCRAQYPSHPIVLLGWGVGAILACYVSLVEKVAANICLGFPMADHEGKRGEADDPLLDMRTPTLFIVGEKSTNATVDDVEDFRYHMPAETDLVVISGADLLLRMSLEKRYWDGLTQSMVDRCIVDEIGDFLTRTLSTEDNNNKPQLTATSTSIPTPIPSTPVVSTATTISSPSYFSSSPSFTNPTTHPLKVGKRELSFQKKRKLSPLTLPDVGSQPPPPKLLRTAISQNLGLKIPVGVSSVLKQQEGKSPLAAAEPEETSLKNNDTSDNGQKGVRSTQEGSLRSYNKPPYPGKIGLKDSAFHSKFQPLPSSCTTPAISSIHEVRTTSSTSMATISLGSLASLTRLKYQQMMPLSEDSLNLHQKTPSLVPTKSAFDWSSSSSRNFKISEGNYSSCSSGNVSSTDSDVDICGLSSVATTPVLGVSDTMSSRDFGPGHCVSSISQEKKYQTPFSSSSGVEHSSSGSILMTSSLISSVSTPQTTKPAPHVRRGPGRPPGKTKANPSQQSKNKVKGAEGSMAVLTLTGPPEGSGVEAAGKGISSLGRGVLTLSRGGTSTVRVYSASGQKMSTANSPSSTSFATSNATQSGTQKSRGFYLTNISSAPSGPSKTGGEKSSLIALSGRGSSGSNDPGVRTVASITPVAALPALSAAPNATSTQVSLNLQGISASRTVSFGTARPAAIMLLTSSSTTSANNSSNLPTNTTTSLSIGGVKTTKSMTGPQVSSAEEAKLEESRPVPSISQEEKNSKSLTEDSVIEVDSPIDITKDDSEKPVSKPDIIEMPTKLDPNEKPISDETEDIPTKSSDEKNVKIKPQETQPHLKEEVVSTSSSTDNSTSIPTSKSTQKTLILGTRMVPSSTAMKPNITFISSRALSHAFPASESATKPSISFIKNPMPSHAASIRLVRSVGTSSSSGFLKTQKSANIVTKTFTFGKDSANSKRRMSLDSGVKNVAKRSRGTSTDEVSGTESSVKNSSNASSLVSNTLSAGPDAKTVSASSLILLPVVQKVEASSKFVPDPVSESTNTSVSSEVVHSPKSTMSESVSKPDDISELVTLPKHMMSSSVDAGSNSVSEREITVLPSEESYQISDTAQPIPTVSQSDHMTETSFETTKSQSELCAEALISLSQKIPDIPVRMSPNYDLANINVSNISPSFTIANETNTADNILQHIDTSVMKSDSISEVACSLMETTCPAKEDIIIQSTDTVSSPSESVEKQPEDPKTESSTLSIDGITEVEKRTEDVTFELNPKSHAAPEISSMEISGNVSPIPKQMEKSSELKSLNAKVQDDSLSTSLIITPTETATRTEPETKVILSSKSYEKGSLSCTEMGKLGQLDSEENKTICSITSGVFAKDKHEVVKQQEQIPKSPISSSLSTKSKNETDLDFVHASPEHLLTSSAPEKITYQESIKPDTDDTTTPREREDTTFSVDQQTPLIKHGDQQQVSNIKQQEKEEFQPDESRSVQMQEKEIRIERDQIHVGEQQQLAKQEETHLQIEQCKDDGKPQQNNQQQHQGRMRRGSLTLLMDSTPGVSSTSRRESLPSALVLLKKKKIKKKSPPKVRVTRSAADRQKRRLRSSL